MRTRGNLDEKRRPRRGMVAPNPDRCKPLSAASSDQLGHVLLVFARPTASAYGLGVTSACWGAAARIVQCRETSFSANKGHLPSTEACRLQSGPPIGGPDRGRAACRVYRSKMTAQQDRWKEIPFINGVPIPFQGRFSREEFDKICKGLVPESMEDKWFAYFKEPYLFLHRSWTGQPIFRVTLSLDGEGASVAEALCVGEVIKKTSPEYEATLLDFLISNLILGQAKPFPVPRNAWEARPGLFQHVVAGTSFPQTRTPARRRWWQLWR